MARTLKEIMHQLAQSSKLSDLPLEVRQRIHGICADFMGGAWNCIRVEDLEITHLKGGTSNILFLCSLPGARKASCNGIRGLRELTTPSELLVRIYFNPNTANHVLEESVVFTLLSERKLGPKLYGIFGEGRLEEYIQSRALRTQEIRVPVVSAKIARILAQIHQLTVPVSKKPTFLGDCMRKWMAQLRSIYQAKNMDSVVVARSSRMEKILSLDQLEAEVELVVRCIQHSTSPVVFCHNDFQEGNILLRTPDPKLDSADFGIIDYEYSSYNYRAFDIANHFCEWTFDYHSNPDHPYFAWTQEFFPNEEQQLIFADSYLREIAKDRSCPDDCPPESPVFILADDVHDLLEEVKPFVPVSHFLWGLWALLLAETSPVQFGYAEYARCRLEIYYHLKADLLKLLPDTGTRVVHDHTVLSQDIPISNGSMNH